MSGHITLRLPSTTTPSSNAIVAMSAAFRISPALWDKIHHFASFPQTGGQSPPTPARVLQLIIFQCLYSRWFSSVNTPVKALSSRPASSSQVTHSSLAPSIINLIHHFQRNFLSASLIVSRSSTNFHTISATCLLYVRSKTGTPNPSRSVSHLLYLHSS